jgi:hypothetical protein
MKATSHERGLAEPVVQDREVVRPEVAHDAGVALVDAQVDPRRGAEVQPADLALAQQLLDVHHRRRIHERVARHEDQLALLGHGDQVLALLHGARHRLLDEHVLARLERAPAQVVVGGDRGCEQDAVDLRVVQDRLKLGDALHVREAPRVPRQRVGIAVARVLDADPLELPRVAQEIGAPVAETDDCPVQLGDG